VRLDELGKARLGAVPAGLVSQITDGGLLSRSLSSASTGRRPPPTVVAARLQERQAHQVLNASMALRLILPEAFLRSHTRGAYYCAAESALRADDKPPSPCHRGDLAACSTSGSLLTLARCARPSEMTEKGSVTEW